MKPKNLFLFGRPGVGKTTLLVNVAKRLSWVRLGGFFTCEIRKAGNRVGFRVETFSGEAATLAHVSFTHGLHVGKYGVDVAEFERVGVTALENAIKAADVILVDEIGKMELFSERFRVAVVCALDAPKPVLATVMAYSNVFVDALKARPDVKLIEVTVSNRNRLVTELADELQRLIA